MADFEEPIIDFRELSSKLPGEGLEELTRHLGRQLGLNSSWEGRGPDGGRDLMFTEEISGPLCKEKITWLVSCKDRTGSGHSVSENDLPSIRDKLEQHKADGFLLVTTTTIATSATKLLDGLDKSNGGSIHTLVWDSSELTALLIKPSNREVLQQFFPNSYKRVMGLTSIEGALSSFEDELPSEVFNEVMGLVKPYSGGVLRGLSIWPYDSSVAKVIDNIIAAVLTRENVQEAILRTEINVNAFMALLESLYENCSDKCQGYLLGILQMHENIDIQFNAAQFYVDHYKIQPDEYSVFIKSIGGAAFPLFYVDVQSFIEDEILTNFSAYGLYQSVDELSSSSYIGDVCIEDLAMALSHNEGEVDFSGEMMLEVDLYFENEKMGARSLRGFFKGHIDHMGICLVEAEAWND